MAKNDIFIKIGADTANFVKSVNEAASAVSASGSKMGASMQEMSTVSMVASQKIVQGLEEMGKKIAKSISASFQPKQMRELMSGMRQDFQQVASIMQTAAGQIASALNAIQQNATKTAKQTKSSIQQIGTGMQGAANDADKGKDRLVDSLTQLQRALMGIPKMQNIDMSLDPSHMLNKTELIKYFELAFGEAIGEAHEKVREKAQPLFRQLGEQVAGVLKQAAGSGKDFASEAMRVMAGRLTTNDPQKFMDLSFVNNQRAVTELVSLHARMTRAIKEEDKLIAEILYRQTEYTARENALLENGRTITTRKVKDENDLAALSVTQLRAETEEIAIHSKNLATEEKQLKVAHDRSALDRRGQSILREAEKIEERRLALADKGRAINNQVLFTSIQVHGRTKEELDALVDTLRKHEHIISAEERSLRSATQKTQFEKQKRDLIAEQVALLQQMSQLEDRARTAAVKRDPSNQNPSSAQIGYVQTSSRVFSPDEVNAAKTPAQLDAFRRLNEEKKASIATNAASVDALAQAGSRTSATNKAANDIDALASRITRLTALEDALNKTRASRGQSTYVVDQAHVIDIARLRASGDAEEIKRALTIAKLRTDAYHTAKEETAQMQASVNIEDRRKKAEEDIVKLRENAAKLLGGAPTMTLDGTRKASAVGGSLLSIGGMTAVMNRNAAAAADDEAMKRVERRIDKENRLLQAQAAAVAALDKERAAARQAGSRMSQADYDARLKAILLAGRTELATMKLASEQRATSLKESRADAAARREALGLTERQAKAESDIAAFRLKATELLKNASGMTIGSTGRTNASGSVTSVAATAGALDARTRGVANEEAMKSVERRIAKENRLLRMQANVVKALDEERKTSQHTASVMSQNDYNAQLQAILRASRADLTAIKASIQERTRLNRENRITVDIDTERNRTLKAIAETQRRLREMSRVSNTPMSGSSEAARIGAANTIASTTSDPRALERIRTEMNAEKALYAVKIQLMNDWKTAYGESQNTVVKMSGSALQTIMNRIRSAGPAQIATLQSAFQTFRNSLDRILDMRKSWAEFSKNAIAAGQTIKSVGNTMVSFAATGAHRLGNALTSVAHYFENVRVMADEAGISLEESQKMLGMFQQYGVSASRSEQAIKMLSRLYTDAMERGGAALQKFNDMGITMGDMARTGGDTNKMFGLISEKLHKIEDPLKRAAAATALVGRSNTMVIPVLTASAEAQKEAAENTIVLSEESAEAALKLSASWEQFQVTIKAATAELLVAVKEPLEGLMGIVRDIIKFFQKWKDVIVPVISVIGKLVAGLLVAAAVIGTVLKVFGVIMIVLGKLAEAWGFVAMAVQVLVGLVPSVGTFGTTVAAVFAALGGPITLVVAGLGAIAYAWYKITNSSRIATEQMKKDMDEAADYVVRSKKMREAAPQIGAEPMTTVQKVQKSDELAKRVRETDDHIEKANAQLFELNKKDAASMTEAEKAAKEKLEQQIIELREVRAGFREDIKKLAFVDPTDAKGADGEMDAKDIVTKKKWEEQYGSEVRRMQDRIRKKEAVTEQDITGVRESLKQTLANAQMSNEERGIQHSRLEAQSNAFLSQASSMNESVVRKTMKKTADDLRKKLLNHEDFSEDFSEFEEYKGSVKDVIGDRYLFPGTDQNIQHDIDMQAEQMKKRALDQRLSAKRDDFKNKIVLEVEEKVGRANVDPATGEIKRQRVLEDLLAQYRVNQMSVFKQAKLNTEEQAAYVSKVEREIMELRRKYKNKEIAMEADTVKAVKELRDSQAQEEKARLDYDLEMKKAATMGRFQREEIDITNQIAAGKMTEGNAERELYLLAQKRHDAEIDFIQEADKLRRASYQQQRKINLQAVKDLEASVKYFEKTYNDKNADTKTREKARENWTKADAALSDARTALIRADRDEAKSANDTTAKIAEENLRRTKENFAHTKKIMEAYAASRKELLGLEKGWADNAVSKAEDAAEAQIEAFKKAGEAALNKAQQIEDGAEREKAVQETTSRLLRDEADLRANLLRTMREAYQSEFGQIFDFLKDLGALTNDTLTTMRDAIEKDITSLLKQHGAAAITNKEFQALYGTYKKVSEELYRDKKDDGMSLGVIRDDKGNKIESAGGAGGFMGGFAKSDNPFGDRMKDLLGRTIGSIEGSMKKMTSDFTGMNGLAISSGNLKNRFDDLNKIIAALNAKLGSTINSFNQQSVTTVPKKSEYMTKTYEQPKAPTPVNDTGTIAKPERQYTDGVLPPGYHRMNDGTIYRGKTGREQSSTINNKTEHHTRVTFNVTNAIATPAVQKSLKDLSRAMESQTAIHDLSGLGVFNV